MIVSCPQCDARYEVDAQVLSPNGRRVRCAKCGHLWTERAPALHVEEVDYAVEDSEADDFRATRRAIGHQKKQKKRGSAIAAWAAIAAVIVVALGAGYFARNAIVSIWEPAARIYQAAGIELEADEIGLEVQVTALRQRRNEEDELVIDVTGEIVNTSSVVKIVPPLEGSLLDVQQQPIHSWRFTATAGQLEPGEATVFNTSVVNPPDGATEVMFRFPPGG